MSPGVRRQHRKTEYKDMEGDQDVMAKKKILIVDDEYDSVTLVQMKLEIAGYEVVSAYDGLSGIDAALTDKPDLILLDLMMPVMDGYETAEKIREMEETKNIPIIFFTAAQKSRLRDIPDMDHHYISKPFDFDELFAKINNLISESGKEEQAEG